ncbi:gluconate 2-dehydrogenase subunit 3 family protein [Paracoccaceae bacterium GXU_MW_L88]
MNRRELMQMIAAVTGTTMVTPKLAWSYQDTEVGENIFSDEDAAFLDEVGEVIIPQTDTPGAKDAAVGAFMTVYVSDCYDAEAQQGFRDGMDQLKARATEAGTDFMEMSPEQRLELITAVATEAKEQSSQEEAEPHWFTPIHQLVLFGFFTSEPGATEVLRYEAAPGEYIGDLDYDGGPAWAT